MMLDTMMAYSEVYEILNLLDKEYKEKVPDKVRTFFEEERLKDYKPEINTDTPLIDQNLKRETIVLLAILNLNYWCDTPEEKQEILDELANNEKEKQELLEKYNPDNLFKKKIEKDYIEEKNSYLPIEVKKQSIFERFINFIQKIFATITQMFGSFKFSCCYFFI